MRLNFFRRSPTPPTPLDLLGADRARRHAEAADYRAHRDAQLCPTRKQYIADLLNGKVRPRKTNKGYPI